MLQWDEDLRIFLNSSFDSVLLSRHKPCDKPNLKRQFYNSISTILFKRLNLFSDCTPPFVVRVHTNAVTDNAAATTANTAYSRGNTDTN